MDVPAQPIGALALAFGLSLAGAEAFAQGWRPLLDPPEHVLTQWTTADGLPQNSVTAIAETPDGYLWVGTFGGLARFDGLTFHAVPRVDSSGSHVDRVLALAVGRDSSLWIGTEAGLLRYRRGAYEIFTTSHGLPDDEVSALHVDRSGRLWIGTSRGGVARYTGVRITPFGARGIPQPTVNSFHEDATGRVWANFPSHFESAAPGDTVLRRTRLPGMEAMVTSGSDGALWFSGGTGLVRMAGDSTRAFDTALGVPARASMIQDPRGGYWLGTANDGLFFFDPARRGDGVRHYALPDGRQKYRVRTSVVDRDGNIWFGTNANGLLRAKRNVFTTYTTEHGLSHDVATAVLADAAGTVWVGTNCGGLNAITPDKRVRTFKPRRPNDPTGDPCIFSLAEPSTGVLFAGTWGGGLTRITNGREDWLRQVDGAPRDSVVLALFTDRSGTLWVGTNSGGVTAIRNGGVVQSYTTAEGLPHNSVRVITQSRDGAIWIGTLGGLSRLHEGRMRTYGAAQGLSAPHVRAIHEDETGDIWVGTYGGGINRLRGDTLVAVRQANGLADDVVSSILADEHGRLWMSGNAGIWRVALADLVAFTEGRTTRIHSVLYGTGDGLIIAETNGGFQPAATRDAEGRFWYPTVQGVAVVDPDHLSVAETPPPVVVEEVVVNGQPRPAGARVDVGPGRTNVEFRYSAISLTAPDHLVFRYRLHNFDDGWVDAGTRRVAYYPRLPQGHYRFEVRAANRDGVWNEAGATQQIEVRGPLWTAWWFRAGIALALTVAIVASMRRRAVLAHRWRVAQEEFSRRLLESQEHERKRVAGELHDGLGQELLVIRNRALLALRARDANEMRGQVEQIGAVADQSIENVRGIAHRLTPYQLDHLGLSTALRTMIGEAAGTSGIRFDMAVDDIDGLLPIEGEINLYRIVQEALNNVVRHSRAGAGAVRARRSGKAIVVTVSDDGRGFSVRRDHAGQVSGGFGLSGILERTRILGGIVDVRSAPGQGTMIEVVIPIDAGVAAPASTISAADATLPPSRSRDGAHPGGA